VASFDAPGGTASQVLVRLTAEHCKRLETAWADSKYHNHYLIRWIVERETNSWVDGIGRPAGSVGFVKLPRRWVVERTFAWLGRYRRTSPDYEVRTCSSESMIRISSIHRMLRLLSPDASKPRTPFKYRETKEIVTG
jgi:putative transposase